MLELTVENTTDGGIACATLPAELSFFDGHFPGAPVLPAAAELDALVLPAVEQLFAELGPVIEVRRFKLPGGLRPGDTVTVKLERRASRVGFRISVDGELRASGTLRFAT